jgi:hypothetical protein
MLRELARTPLLGRLKTLLESECSKSGLPILALPDSLLACIFSFSGLPTTLSASLSCRSANAQLWQNPAFWQSLLCCLGVADTSLRALQTRELSSWFEPRDVRCNDNALPKAKAFWDFARHWLLGIDVLVGMPVTLKGDGATSSFTHRWRCREHAGALDLEDARRAVLALQPEDGKRLIQRAADSVTALLRDRVPGEKEMLKAEELLEAVATRVELFSTSQMLDMLGAHQRAEEEHTLRSSVPKADPGALSYAASTERTSRRTRRALAAGAA